MIDWFELADKVLVGWLGVSLLMALGWSRFMGYLHWKERDLATVECGAESGRPPAGGRAA